MHCYAAAAAFNARSQGLGNGKRLPVAGVGQQHQKLLAANSRQRIAVADTLLKNLCNLAQNDVTVQVTVSVVDLLEVVQIEYKHGKFVVEIALGARRFLG